MLATESLTSKPSDVFKICRDLQIPKSPPSNALDDQITEQAAELRDLLSCLSILKVARKEIEHVKIQKLSASLRAHNSADVATKRTSPSVSQCSMQIESILESHESLEDKALKVWETATQVNPAAYTVEGQRSILCESPNDLRKLRLRAYQLWDTYTYKELSLLSEPCDNLESRRKLYCESSFVKLIQRQPHGWMSWSLQTASFQAMVRTYVIGLKIMNELSSRAAFDDAFELRDLLQLPSDASKGANSRPGEFHEFAYPLLTESHKLLEDKCKGHFQGLFQKFLQSLGGSYVLLRLQTTRKVRIEGPVECLKELEALAKETQSSLQRAPKDLVEAIWLSYVRGFEASTMKSAKEIHILFKGAHKLENLEESPFQQLLLNAQSVKSILSKFCPPDLRAVFRVVDTLILELSGMK